MQTALCCRHPGVLEFKGLAFPQGPFFSNERNDQPSESTIHRKKPSDHGHDLGDLPADIGHFELSHFSVPEIVHSFESKVKFLGPSICLYKPVYESIKTWTVMTNISS